MRGSRRRSPGSSHQDVTLRGMQSSDLVARDNHPAWQVLMEVGEQDSADEHRMGEPEVDIDDISQLEARGDEATFRELGGAFLRIAERHGLVFEPESENPGR